MMSPKPSRLHFYVTALLLGFLVLSVSYAAYQTYGGEEEIRQDVLNNLSLTPNDADEQFATAEDIVAKIDNALFKRNMLSLLCLLNFIALSVSLAFSIHKAQTESQGYKIAEKRSRLFASALQSTRVGVIIRDAREPGRPAVFVNNAFTQISGFSLKDIITREPDFLFGVQTDKESIRKLKEAEAQGHSLSVEMVINRKNGTPLWSDWHISPIIQDEIVSHYVTLITDVHNAHQTQEALTLAKEEAEKASNIKGTFLATMSHEIRTPINGIVGVLELLRDSRLSGDQQKLVTTALSSTQSLLEIINDILDYSKMEAGKLDISAERINLPTLVENIMSLMSPITRGKNLTLDYEIDSELNKDFIGDGSRIRQIILNLVTNAIKFTERGGIKINVRSLLTRDDHTQTLTLMRIEVIDTGIGISPEDQEKLFKEFSQVERSYTRRFGGTGLGLAITKQLVKLLSGEVGVESRSGEGSKFWVMLPLQQAKEEDLIAVHVPPPKPEIIPLSTSNKKYPFRLLLAEDNSTNQLVIRRHLEKVGCLIDVANNGQEAVNMFPLIPYDAVLMDVSMPVVDGFEATQQIRAMDGAGKTVPIIALTAHVMRGDHERCLAAGMNDYLSKPINIDQLLQCLVHWTKKDGIHGPQQPTTSLPDQSPPVADQGAPLLFDSAALKRLADDLGSEMMIEITNVFLGDFEKRIEKIINYIDEKKLADLGRESHALKSSCASCGLLLASDLMRQIEKSADAKDLDAISALSAQINDVYQRSYQALAEGRQSLAATD